MLARGRAAGGAAFDASAHTATLLQANLLLGTEQVVAGARRLPRCPVLVLFLRFTLPGFLRNAAVVLGAGERIAEAARSGARRLGIGITLIRLRDRGAGQQEDQYWKSRAHSFRTADAEPRFLGAVHPDMDTHALHPYPARAELPRWLIVGFISGAVAVLVFHQGALGLLHALQLSPRAPYSFATTQPFGIPQVWSLAFWGGVWGVVLAAALARLHGAGLVIAATIFGAI